MSIIIIRNNRPIDDVMRNAWLRNSKDIWLVIIM